MFSLIDRIQKQVERQSLDYWSLRFDSNKSLSIKAENGSIEELNDGIIEGLSLRVLVKGNYGFAFSNNFKNFDSENFVLKAVKSAVLLPARKKVKLPNQKPVKKKLKVKEKKLFSSLSLEQKSLKLKKLSLLPLKLDSSLKQSRIILVENKTEKTLINSFGSQLQQTIPRTLLNVFVTGKKQENLQGKRASKANVGGLEIAFNDNSNSFVENTAKTVLQLLDSKPLKSENASIIVDPELSDVFAHEAIGHAMELDAVNSHASVLRGMLGKKICSSKINLVDEPNAKGFGQTFFDDEGTQSRKVFLIRNGVLKEYLNNLELAGALGFKPTGHARAQAFNFQPIIRMTNTFFEKGKTSYSDLLETTRNGLLLKGFNGGQVDPATGTFMFGIEQAFKIVKGEVKESFTGASISGNIKTFLTKIDLLSNKVGEFNPGFCGKEGQSVPVSGGGPFIKLSDVRVSGRK
ncbi:MAG: TldD/PmbA family protein [archaeon]